MNLLALSWVKKAAKHYYRATVCGNNAEERERKGLMALYILIHKYTNTQIYQYATIRRVIALLGNPNQGMIK